jgi:hypothetical protein
MPYLSGAARNTFENAVLTPRTTPSKQLNHVVTAVRAYLTQSTEGHIRDVKFCWEAWKKDQNTEFQNKTWRIRDDFETEIVSEFRRQGIKVDAGPDPISRLAMLPAPQTAINYWTYYAKKAAKYSLPAGSAAITAVGTATGAGGLLTVAEALAVGAGVALSATGVGLIAGGLALTVGTSLLSGVSAAKSYNHRDALIKLYERRDQDQFGDPKFCQSTNPDAEQRTPAMLMQHDIVANLVLPYIIHQKDTKGFRKSMGAIPVFGMLETVRGAGHYMIKKYYHRTQGNMRRNAAGWLADHLIGCNCLLVQSIVAELYSRNEMEWLKFQEYKTVTAHLERKLKSS